MIHLVPITFTKKQLYRAEKSKEKLIVPCRENKAYFKQAYLRHQPNHEEDVVIRKDLYLFGDHYDFTAEWIEKGYFVPNEITEHFPVSTKKGLLFLLKEIPELFPPLEFIEKTSNEKWITVKENFTSLQDYVKAQREELRLAYQEYQKSA